MLAQRILDYKQNNPDVRGIKDTVLISDIEQYPLDLPFKQKIAAILLNVEHPPKCECGADLNWNSKKRSNSKYGTPYGGWNEFCSVDCMRKSPSTVEKRRQTFLKKYGTETWAQSKEAKEVLSKPWSDEKKQQYKEKCKETNLAKRGVEHHSQTKEYLEKRSKTILEKSGGLYTNSFQDVDKIKATNLAKYGVDHYNKTAEGQVKLSKNNGMKRAEIARKSAINRLMKSSKDKTLIDLLIIKDNNAIKNYLTEIMESNKFSYRQELSAYLNISYTYLNAIMRECGMRDMYLNYGAGSSYKEYTVYEYVKSLGVNVINSDRKLLNGLEIDILCHDQKLGIEFNGMKYHSVLGGKDKHYHINKTHLMEDKGYQLLHIFESEWDDLNKKEIWKSIIKSKLGLVTNKVYARKCILQPISATDARIFFDSNHLSGFIAAKNHYGLYYNNELVSAISVGPSRFAANETEIYRFASLLDHSVIGALGKFISKINEPNLVTFADRRLSGIDSAYNQFFSNKKELGPSWWGMEVGVYEPRHRLNFTKSNLLKLIPNYDHSKSAIDNMLLNGYDMIYDCGNWKFFN